MTSARPGSLVERARISAGLSGAELARRAGTSRPTLAAYEHGSKSPTLSTAERIIGAAGYALDLRPTPTFRQHGHYRGRPIMVPDVLPRRGLAQAVGRVRLPLHLNWSDPDRRYDLALRRHRLRLYEIVIREGSPTEVLDHIDGAFLIDSWPDLVLPGPIRTAWQHLAETPR